MCVYSPQKLESVSSVYQNKKTRYENKVKVTERSQSTAIQKQTEIKLGS